MLRLAAGPPSIRVLFSGRFIGTTFSTLAALPTTNTTMIIMRTTPPFLMVFVTLRHHNIDSMFHSSTIFLLVQVGDPTAFFQMSFI
jgi:hypothetical protein